ncbi:MAG: AI-2E family transporter [Gammaproteobacteria bacterium]|nr:AI-2E family transporter [Gammaproteobacteria bacterium]
MTQLSTPLKVLLVGAAFVVVVAGMRAAESVLVPFLLSVFIAVISTPFLFWLQRMRVPSMVAVMLIIGVIVALAVGLGVLVSSSIDDFISNLPIYESRLRDELVLVLDWLQKFGIEISRKGLLEYFDPGKVFEFAGTTLKSLGGVLSNLFLILLTVVFILFEASGFRAKLQTILEDPDRSLPHFSRFSDTLKQYMIIKTLVSIVTGIIIAIWLAILGVDYPLLWGVLAFALNYVPNIGSIIAAVPAVLLALIQVDGQTAILAAVGYVVVNLVMGNAVEPRFMGRHLGLSTLVVFLSLVFWGWVLGPVGMLLSVPLTMTVKIALESQDDTKWMAVMLGPQKELSS